MDKEKGPRINGQKDVFILERASKPEEKIINPVSFAQRLKLKGVKSGFVIKNGSLGINLVDEDNKIISADTANIYVLLPNVNVAKSDYLEGSQAGSPSDWREHQFDPKNLSLS